ncbi:hypothetical protein FZEAL_6984 [Fusarium zealandicum]|uniref:Uncharacterized protein n=1 Tax=Fusarium zealandicum TaxID=1053134 RepID=A0A8H4UGU8_9HYPO|nr:hypothetical protein FZEAL_6984 [Fusarium zealandicum]
MIPSLALLAGTIAAVTAASETTTVNFLMPDWDGLNLSASVVAVRGDETTLAVACEGITLDWRMCGSNPQTIVGGPSTVSVTWVDKSAHVYWDVFTPKSQDHRCEINQQLDTATCISTGIWKIQGKMETTVITEERSSVWAYYYPVTVTAGAEKLRGENSDSTKTVDAVTTNSASDSQAASISDSSVEFTTKTKAYSPVPSPQKDPETASLCFNYTAGSY